MSSTRTLPLLDENILKRLDTWHDFGRSGQRDARGGLRFVDAIGTSDGSQPPQFRIRNNSGKDEIVSVKMSNCNKVATDTAMFGACNSDIIQPLTYERAATAAIDMCDMENARISTHSVTWDKIRKRDSSLWDKSKKRWKPMSKDVLVINGDIPRKAMKKATAQLRKNPNMRNDPNNVNNVLGSFILSYFYPQMSQPNGISNGSDILVTFDAAPKRLKDLFSCFEQVKTLILPQNVADSALTYIPSDRTRTTFIFPVDKIANNSFSNSFKCTSPYYSKEWCTIKFVNLSFNNASPFNFVIKIEWSGKNGKMQSYTVDYSTCKKLPSGPSAQYLASLINTIIILKNKGVQYAKLTKILNNANLQPLISTILPLSDLILRIFKSIDGTSEIKIKKIVGLLLDLKRTGDYEQVNAANWTMKNGTVPNVLMATIDIMCSTYARSIKLPCILHGLDGGKEMVLFRFPNQTNANMSALSQQQQQPSITLSEVDDFFDNIQLIVTSMDKYNMREKRFKIANDTLEILGNYIKKYGNQIFVRKFITHPVLDDIQSHLSLIFIGLINKILNEIDKNILEHINEYQNGTSKRNTLVAKFKQLVINVLTNSNDAIDNDNLRFLKEERDDVIQFILSKHPQNTQNSQIDVMDSLINGISSSYSNAQTAQTSPFKKDTIKKNMSDIRELAVLCKSYMDLAEPRIYKIMDYAGFMDSTLNDADITIIRMLIDNLHDPYSAVIIAGNVQSAIDNATVQNPPPQPDIIDKVHRVFKQYGFNVISFQQKIMQFISRINKLPIKLRRIGAKNSKNSLAKLTRHIPDAIRDASFGTSTTVSDKITQLANLPLKCIYDIESELKKKIKAQPQTSTLTERELRKIVHLIITKSSIESIDLSSVTQTRTIIVQSYKERFVEGVKQIYTDLNLGLTPAVEQDVINYFNQPLSSVASKQSSIASSQNRSVRGQSGGAKVKHDNNAIIGMDCLKDISKRCKDIISERIHEHIYAKIDREQNISGQMIDGKFKLYSLLYNLLLCIETFENDMRAEIILTNNTSQRVYNTWRSLGNNLLSIKLQMDSVLNDIIFWLDKMHSRSFKPLKRQIKLLINWITGFIPIIITTEDNPRRVSQRLANSGNLNSTIIHNWNSLGKFYEGNRINLANIGILKNMQNYTDIYQYTLHIRQILEGLFNSEYSINLATIFKSMTCSISSEIHYRNYRSTIEKELSEKNEMLHLDICDYWTELLFNEFSLAERNDWNYLYDTDIVTIVFNDQSELEWLNQITKLIINSPSIVFIMALLHNILNFNTYDFNPFIAIDNSVLDFINIMLSHIPDDGSSIAILDFFNSLGMSIDTSDNQQISKSVFFDLLNFLRIYNHNFSTSNQLKFRLPSNYVFVFVNDNGLTSLIKKKPKSREIAQLTPQQLRLQHQQQLQQYRQQLQQLQLQQHRQQLQQKQMQQHQQQLQQQKQMQLRNPVSNTELNFRLSQFQKGITKEEMSRERSKKNKQRRQSRRLAMIYAKRKQNMSGGRKKKTRKISLYKAHRTKKPRIIIKKRYRRKYIRKKNKKTRKVPFRIKHRRKHKTRKH